MGKKNSDVYFIQKMCCPCEGSSQKIDQYFVVDINNKHRNKDSTKVEVFIWRRREIDDEQI